MKRLLTLCGFLLTYGLLHAQSPYQAPAKTTGPDGSSGGRAVAVDAAGAVYTTGYFSGTIDFDPATANLTAAGEGCYISKLDAAGGDALVLYPNPASAAVILRSEESLKDTDSVCSIYTGRWWQNGAV